MKRTRLFATTAMFTLLFALPQSTKAVYATPSDVLSVLTHDGYPQKFSVQANQFSPDGSSETAVWVEGIQEGNGDFYKLKADVALRKRYGAGTTKVKARIMVHEGVEYIKINEWTMEHGGIIENMMTQRTSEWGEVPVGASFNPKAAIGALGVLDDLHLDPLMTGALWEGIVAVADLLHMKHIPFHGGSAYSLEHKLQDQNIHIRVNTDTTGVFHYAKFYAHMGDIVLQGNMQPTAERVYLGIPSRTVAAHGMIAALQHDVLPTPLGNTVYAKPAEGHAEAWVHEPVSMRRKRPATVRQEFAMPDRSYNRNLAQQEEDLLEYNAEKYTKALAYKQSPEINRNASARRVFRDAFMWRNTKLSPLWGERSEWSQPERDSTSMNMYRERAKHDAFTEEFAYSASRRQTHRLKTMMSADLLETLGETVLEKWIEDQIIPFFIPIDNGESTEVLGAIIAKDSSGQIGILIHKSAMTHRGTWKDFTVFVVDEMERPKIRDFFPNMSPQDIGVERHGDTIATRTNMDQYRYWMDLLVIEFDNRDWQPDNTDVTNGVTTMEYVLPGQSANSWDELVTIEEHRFGHHDARQSAIDFMGKLVLQCPDIEWNMLNDTHQDIMVEWRGECSSLPEQHELRRFFVDDHGVMYVLSYTAKTYRIDSGIRTIWIDLLKDAHTRNETW